MPKKEFTENNTDYYNIEHSPFKIYGVFKEDGEFVRMPKAVAEKVSDGVAYHNYHTAGGRIKFKSNTKHIAIKVKLNHVGKMPHFAYTGSVGMDYYVKKNGENIYCGTFIPSVDVENGYEAVSYFENDTVSEITVNMPLYTGVCEVLIGVNENAVIEEADDYTYQKPVVFYGSSITQGGCASRPGMSYENILTRELDFDYINLGFAGNAKAEDEMMNYIATLDMSVFVYDYDHNAPTHEHLIKTHENGFRIIRKSHPDVPIIIMTRPKYTLNIEEERNLEIIKKTYENAVMQGDKNVYFITGKALMNTAKDDGTVDNTHPTDLGFYSMAKETEKVLKRIM